MSRSGPFANDEWIVRCQLWRICLHSRASWKVKPEWHFVFNNSQKCGGKKYELQLMIPPCMMTRNTRNWKEQGQQADLNFAGGEAWRSTGCLEPKASTKRIEWSFWELTKEIWIEMDGGGIPLVSCERESVIWDPPGIFFFQSWAVAQFNAVDER